MEEVAVKEHVYRLGKMSPMDQFHVVRRMGPEMMGPLAAIAKAGGAEKMKAEDFTLALYALMRTLSKFSNDDAEYVIYTCLGVAQRKDKDKYYPVVAQAKPGVQPSLMYEDLGMDGMMRLTYYVLEHNLGGFSVDHLASGA